MVEAVGFIIVALGAIMFGGAALTGLGYIFLGAYAALVGILKAFGIGK